MKAMCEFLGVARAPYYEWLKKLEGHDPDQERMELVQAAYETSHRTYAYRRITLHLQQKQGIHLNHKTVLRLMHKLHIRSVARKRNLHKKLEELGTYHQYPNLLNRDFTATHPNQKWVTDITYEEVAAERAMVATEGRGARLLALQGADAS